MHHLAKAVVGTIYLMNPATHQPIYYQPDTTDAYVYEVIAKLKPACNNVTIIYNSTPPMDVTIYCNFDEYGTDKISGSGHNLIKAQEDLAHKSATVAKALQ